MRLALDLIGGLEGALLDSARAAGIEPGAFEPGVRTADARHGDFQANGVLAAGKRPGRPPRPFADAIAAGLAEAVRQDYDVSVAGPGFINFSAKPSLLLDWLKAHRTRAALEAGAAAAHAGETWVVDYSSPNTAKQMHVGHLRSAVIGEAISRLLAFTGARVLRDNHIGDWGTQFGKLIWAYKRHLDPAALAAEPLEEFERLYKLGNQAAEADPAVLAAAQQELVRLQGGDEANLVIWREINT